jgi:hypothetical protein
MRAGRVQPVQSAPQLETLQSWQILRRSQFFEFRTDPFSEEFNPVNLRPHKVSEKRERASSEIFAKGSITFQSIFQSDNRASSIFPTDNLSDMDS